MSSVPDLRIRMANDANVQTEGDYVLYWMTAFRRTEWNFSLQRATEWSRDLNKPLLVFEALRCDYHWASDRIHLFVIQGMADNARRLARRKGVIYYPYLEPKQGAGKGLLAALAGRACVVVSDDFPCFFLPADGEGGQSKGSRALRVGRFQRYSTNASSGQDFPPRS